MLQARVCSTSGYNTQLLCGVKQPGETAAVCCNFQHMYTPHDEPQHAQRQQTCNNKETRSRTAAGHLVKQQLLATRQINPFALGGQPRGKKPSITLMGELQGRRTKQLAREQEARRLRWIHGKEFLPARTDVRAATLVL